MIRQKNSDLKKCRKCTVLLTNENWLNYLQKRNSYICTICFREYSKTHYKLDCNYNNKQKNRTRRRRSAVILAYGNKCNSCYEDQYEKLTIDCRGADTQYHKDLSSNIINYLYNNPVQDGYHVLCYNCSCTKNTNYKDKYALRDKIKTIIEYGGQCMICQENKIERLIFDRLDLKLSGIKLYRWLIKNKYPKNLGLQVLCHNCYHSKHAALKLLQEEPIKT